MPDLGLTGCMQLRAQVCGSPRIRVGGAVEIEFVEFGAVHPRHCARLQRLQVSQCECQTIRR
jgi:hypothetical protein